MKSIQSKVFVCLATVFGFCSPTLAQTPVRSSLDQPISAAKRLPRTSLTSSKTTNLAEGRFLNVGGQHIKTDNPGVDPSWRSPAVSKVHGMSIQPWELPPQAKASKPSEPEIASTGVSLNLNDTYLASDDSNDAVAESPRQGAKNTNPTTGATAARRIAVDTNLKSARPFSLHRSASQIPSSKFQNPLLLIPIQASTKPQPKEAESAINEGNSNLEDSFASFVPPQEAASSQQKIGVKETAMNETPSRSKALVSNSESLKLAFKNAAKKALDEMVQEAVSEAIAEIGLDRSQISDKTMQKLENDLKQRMMIQPAVAKHALPQVLPALPIQKKPIFDEPPMDMADSIIAGSPTEGPTTKTNVAVSLNAQSQPPVYSSARAPTEPLSQTPRATVIVQDPRVQNSSTNLRRWPRDFRRR
ncbi:MAG: hypothetical protein AAF939_12560 [Planctomycetota bacterium]